MKEESLFRGQRLDNKEWVEGDYIASDFISPWKNGELYVKKTYTDGMEWGEGCFYRIIPETVGKYIGQKDKNGKKIFDNHIVFLPKVFNGKGDTAIFIKDGINYYLKGKLSNYEISRNTNSECYEIIGDIFDKTKFL